jgi:hypothetical protein
MIVLTPELPASERAPRDVILRAETLALSREATREEAREADEAAKALKLTPSEWVALLDDADGRIAEYALRRVMTLPVLPPEACEWAVQRVLADDDRWRFWASSLNRAALRFLVTDCDTVEKARPVLEKWANEKRHPFSAVAYVVCLNRTHPPPPEAKGELALRFSSLVRQMGGAQDAAEICALAGVRLDELIDIAMVQPEGRHCLPDLMSSAMATKDPTCHLSVAAVAFDAPSVNQRRAARRVISDVQRTSRQGKGGWQVAMGRHNESFQWVDQPVYIRTGGVVAQSTRSRLDALEYGPPQLQRRAAMALAYARRSDVEAEGLLRQLYSSENDNLAFAKALVGLQLVQDKTLDTYRLMLDEGGQRDRFLAMCVMASAGKAQPRLFEQIVNQMQEGGSWERELFTFLKETVESDNRLHPRSTRINEVARAFAGVSPDGRKQRFQLPAKLRESISALDTSPLNSYEQRCLAGLKERLAEARSKGEPVLGGVNGPGFQRVRKAHYGVYFEALGYRMQTEPDRIVDTMLKLAEFGSDCRPLLPGMARLADHNPDARGAFFVVAREVAEDGALTSEELFQEIGSSGLGKPDWLASGFALLLPSDQVSLVARAKVEDLPLIIRSGPAIARYRAMERLNREKDALDAPVLLAELRAILEPYRPYAGLKDHPPKLCATWLLGEMGTDAADCVPLLDRIIDLGGGLQLCAASARLKISTKGGLAAWRAILAWHESRWEATAKPGARDFTEYMLRSPAWQLESDLAAVLPSLSTHFEQLWRESTITGKEVLLACLFVGKREIVTDANAMVLIRSMCDRDDAVSNLARSGLIRMGEAARPMLLKASASSDEFLSFFARDVLSQPPFSGRAKPGKE